MTDALHEAAVQLELTTNWIGRPYYYTAETGSTNDQLKELVDAGTLEDLPAGTVLLTDYQSAGRGRLGRRWEAPSGSSLLFSTLFRPNWPASQAGWLTMLAGLAIAEAIEIATGLTVGLKWPNDVMVVTNDQWYKVGGLLLDSQMTGDRLSYAILGTGLNVNVPSEELPDTVTPATSLMAAIGHRIERRPLLLACLSRLEQCYEAAERGQSPRAAWNDRLITLGQSVTVSNGAAASILAGVAEATDEFGRLLIRDETGVMHSVSAGDVTLRGQQ